MAVPPAEIARLATRHVWHHATQVAEYADVGPVVLVSGSGVMVADAAGRQYIDATSILGVTQIGHGRKEMAEAVAAQIQRLEYGACAEGFSNDQAALLGAKLAELTPGDLSVAYFCTSGTEAIEAALKIALQYQLQKGFPRRSKIVARRGSYHGTTRCRPASRTSPSRISTARRASSAVRRRRSGRRRPRRSSAS
jgi:adenosylmethionine-8-amino-7-oxononanoate aminotransferase